MCTIDPGSNDTGSAFVLRAWPTVTARTTIATVSKSRWSRLVRISCPSTLCSVDVRLENTWECDHSTALAEAPLLGSPLLATRSRAMSADGVLFLMIVVMPAVLPPRDCDPGTPFAQASPRLTRSVWLEGRRPRCRGASTWRLAEYRIGRPA